MIAGWQRRCDAITAELRSSPRALTAYELSGRTGIEVKQCTTILRDLEARRIVVEAGEIPIERCNPVILWRLARWSSPKPATGSPKQWPMPDAPSA